MSSPCQAFASLPNGQMGQMGQKGQAILGAFMCGFNRIGTLCEWRRVFVCFESIYSINTQCPSVAQSHGPSWHQLAHETTTKQQQNPSERVDRNFQLRHFLFFGVQVYACSRAPSPTWPGLVVPFPTEQVVRVLKGKSVSFINRNLRTQASALQPGRSVEYLVPWLKFFFFFFLPGVVWNKGMKSRGCNWKVNVIFMQKFAQQQKKKKKRQTVRGWRDFADESNRRRFCGKDNHRVLWKPSSPILGARGVRFRYCGGFTNFDLAQWSTTVQPSEIAAERGTPTDYCERLWQRQRRKSSVCERPVE